MRRFDGALLALGVAARLIAASAGHNYDMESFFIVAKIVEHGGNVYASTSRNNYAPIWSTLLHGLDLAARVLPFDWQHVLRYGIAGVLTLVDVAICLLLRRRCCRVAAYAFFLNPVSIIITGYHSQFDNAALLLGLLAVTLIGEDTGARLTWRVAAGWVLLGVSLMTKHILFAFPLWLAIKARSWPRRILTLIVPVAVFLAGFVGYWSTGGAGIVRNVFSYNSYSNPYFYQQLVPAIVARVLTAKQLWLLVLVVFGFLMRREGAWESLLVYSAVLVVASPAITNQYLAIPVPFTAVYFNVFSCAYAAVGAWHLGIDYDGLNLTRLHGVDWTERNTYYSAAVWILCAAIVWARWRPAFASAAKRLVKPISGRLRGGPDTGR